MYQVYNSVTFSTKPIGPEEYLSQMVEALGIIIDRCPKRRTCKRENQTIEKIECVSIFQLNKRPLTHDKE